MPAIGFKGFTAGVPVALLADQGAVSAGNSVASWGGTLGEIGIEVTTAASVSAPAAVWVEATSPAGFTLSMPPAGTPYDPSFHEITYVWTLRGDPLPPFTAPQNIVAGWNNPNVMYGKRVAFSLPDPGTYDIDLWCMDVNGVTATATRQIIVNDPDAVFPGIRTVCLALDGDFTSAPAGCQKVSSEAGLRSAISGFGVNGRVLFKRGETVTLTETLPDNNNWLYLGAWGSGAKPVVEAPQDDNFAFGRTIRRVAGPTEITVTDLHFQGGWDSAAEAGRNDQDAHMMRDNGTVCFSHFHNLTIDGFSIFEAAPGSAGSSGGSTVLSNCEITNWRDYGVFINGSEGDRRWGAIGCRIAQNVDAKNGGPKGGMHNNHGPIRISYVTKVYIAQCDLFSRNGWSPLTTDTADQPCLRLNTGPDNTNGEAIVERCVMEGGWRQIELSEASGGGEAVAGNYVIERNLLISSSKSIFTFIYAEYGGATIRNNVGIMPNAPQYHSNGWRGGVFLATPRTNTVNNDTPVQIYNNTFINLRDTTNDPGDEWPALLNTGSHTNVTVENNVAYAPGIDTPVDAEIPLDLTAAFAGITPRYKGVWFEGDAVIDTNYASPSTLPVPRPEAGPQTAGSGDLGRSAYVDFFGRVRPQTGDTRGALLPG